ncbi:MAG: hypothetical protein RL199_1431 [Pseudomonadota bacterium]
MRRRLLTPLLLALLLAPEARADGAFPDSNNLTAPAGTKRLLLSTTFGLVLSDDDGATWFWVCEEAIGPNVVQYQAAAPPSLLLWSVDANNHLHRSPDGGRTWSSVTDALVASGDVTDVFPDPNDGRRAIAAYQARDGTGTAPWQVIETVDGGESFRVLYTAPSGARVESLEIAVSDARAVTVALLATDGAEPVPSLVRTLDGGTWTTLPLEPTVGRHVVRIASVDSSDPSVAYLRVFAVETGAGTPDKPAVVKDALAIVRGDTVTMPLVLDGPMSTFLRRADGTLLVAGATAGAFRSQDGATFEPWTTAPRLRALAEREGVLYAAADAFRDGYAAARSPDGGASWQKMLAWPDLCGIYPSEQLADVCRMPWRLTADRFGVEPPDACPKAPVPATPDPTVPTTTKPPQGCGCGGAGSEVLALVGLAAMIRRRSAWAGGGRG